VGVFIDRFYAVLKTCCCYSVDAVSPYKCYEHFGFIFHKNLTINTN